MQALTFRSPIALFSALTRAVREEAMPEPDRALAFARLEAMAAHVGQPEVRREVEDLERSLQGRRELQEAVGPFLPALRELVEVDRLLV